MKINSETIKKFIDLVGQMRITQKEYFKSRSAASLSKARSLERAVDSELKNFKEPNLFS